MEKQDLILTEEICSRYEIEYSFIKDLEEHDLIACSVVEQTTYLAADNLSDLERFIRLHYDLHINMEGLEAVTHLLQRIENMQDQINQLENRLQLFDE